MFVIWQVCLLRGEQKNRKTDLIEKTEKKLTEKTEPVQKIDWIG
jgi:hypothetical protein